MAIHEVRGLNHGLKQEKIVTENNEKIVQAIFDAMDEYNEQYSGEEKLVKSIDTVLLGGISVLDSLGLANLIVAAEQRLEDTFGISLTLADEKAISQKNSPFRTIGTLVEYTSILLNEEMNE